MSVSLFPSDCLSIGSEELFPEDDAAADHWDKGRVSEAAVMGMHQCFRPRDGGEEF
jgi:hypothetical protein